MIRGYDRPHQTATLALLIVLLCSYPKVEIMSVSWVTTLQNNEKKQERELLVIFVVPRFSVLVSSLFLCRMRRIHRASIAIFHCILCCSNPAALDHKPALQLQSQQVKIIPEVRFCSGEILGLLHAKKPSSNPLLREKFIFLREKFIVFC